MQQELTGLESVATRRSASTLCLTTFCMSIQCGLAVCLPKAACPRIPMEAGVGPIYDMICYLNTSVQSMAWRYNLTPTMCLDVHNITFVEADKVRRENSTDWKAAVVSHVSCGALGACGLAGCWFSPLPSPCLFHSLTRQS